MFGIIDANSTLQIIAADWIEEYYDDQYFALLLRKKLSCFELKEFPLQSYDIFYEGFFYSYGSASGAHPHFVHGFFGNSGEGFGDGNGDAFGLRDMVIFE